MSSTAAAQVPVELHGWRLWLTGARPKTLPAAIVPVLLGTAAADLMGRSRLGHAALALVVSLALQVGVNYANDYSDGIRGTDSSGLRVGPPRLVGWGLATPIAVKRAMAIAFLVAAIAGLLLALRTTPWLVAVGGAAIVAAWFYTGGSRPYGYAGFGELFVFVFFGLVAVLGTLYVQTEQLSSVGWWCGMGAGLAATALLVVNNLRDIPGDTIVGKKTLAVRIGDKRTRSLYIACLSGAVAVPLMLAISVDEPVLALGTLSAVYAVAPIAMVRRGTSGRALVEVLVKTGRFQLAYGALVSILLVVVGRIS